MKALKKSARKLLRAMEVDRGNQGEFTKLHKDYLVARRTWVDRKIQELAERGNEISRTISNMEKI